MQESGLDRHAWESEFLALEDELKDDPSGALPELDSLIRRILEETNYELDDPVARVGEEREVVAEFLAAQEITQAVERGSDELSPGDVAAAINGYRAIFEYIIENRPLGELDSDSPEE